MYYYIVDPQNLTQRQFERVQNKLYSCLSAYKINGETSRVTSLRTISQLVDTAFAHGAKTLVAVGSDDTLTDLINAIKGREVLIGFIPLQDSEAGQILGIDDVEMGCKIIAQRRIMLLDLGLVIHPPNLDGPTRGTRPGTLFLTKLAFGVNLPHRPFDLGLIKQLFSLPTFEIQFHTPDYTATSKVVGGQIVNSRGWKCGNSRLTSPQDGILEVLSLPNLSRWSLIKYRRQIIQGCFDLVPGNSLVHVAKLEIISPEGLPLRVNNRVVAKTPAQIEVLPRAVKIITGKDRLF